MVITNSCAAENEMLRTSKQTTLYMPTRAEIGFLDRAQDIRNPKQLICTPNLKTLQT